MVQYHPQITDWIYIFEANPYVHDDWAIVTRVQVKKMQMLRGGVHDHTVDEEVASL